MQWQCFSILLTVINFLALAGLVMSTDLPIWRQPCILFPVVQRIDAPISKSGPLMGGIHLRSCELHNPEVGVAALSVYRDFNRQIQSAIQEVQSQGLQPFPLRISVIPNILEGAEYKYRVLYVPEKLWKKGDALEDLLVKTWLKQKTLSYK